MREIPVSVLEGELREAGLRVTSQRLQVLRIITEADDHLSAEDIHAIVREQEGGVSLATVYRTLNALKETDLLESQYLSRHHHRERFERARQPGHYHFKCQRCSRIYEFESNVLHPLRAELKSKRGWDLKEMCMCFEGICEQCGGPAVEGRAEAEV
jgi:Fur family ferric uptake transcriptional regulator